MSTESEVLEEALETARSLASLGVRLFVAERAEDRDGSWNVLGGSGASGYWLPPEWERIAVADPAVVDSWRPGMGLAAVMGDLLDCIDVDPRNGGSLDEIGELLPSVYAVADTPSGGQHHLVGSLGIRKCAPFPGVDIQAGANGSGCGFIWLAPTRRKSKTDGKIRAYEWSVFHEERLDDLAMLGDDGTGDALRDHIVGLSASQKAATIGVSPEWSDLSPTQQKFAADADADLVGYWRQRIAKVEQWPEGHRENDKGWEAVAKDMAWSFAMRAASGWSPMDEDAAGEAFAECLGEIMGADLMLTEKWRDGLVAKAIEQGAAHSPPWPAAFDTGEPTHDGIGLVTRVLIHKPPVPRWKTSPPSRPTEVAADLLKHLWTNRDECLLIRHWMGDTYEWHVTHWEKMPSDHLESVLQHQLESAYYLAPPPAKAKTGPVEKEWAPTPPKVAAVATSLRRATIVHARTGANHWIDCTSGRCPVGEFGRRYMSFRNGILDLDQMVLLEHDSAFFNTYSLSFNFDQSATCPRWEQALEEWFPRDKKAQEHLEEVMAYLILRGLVQDKIFVWLGESRAGKGTVMRLIGLMLGVGMVTQSLDDLADRFALEDLIGALVVHIAEAASTRDTRRVASLVKSISGRDYEGTKIKKKNDKSEQNVTLDCAFVFTGNEDLNLPDSSGTIAERVEALWWGQSFLGREDPTFEPKLIAEASGIFNRLLVAHDRLLKRKKFEQPASGQVVKDQIRQTAAPDKVWFTNTFEATGDISDSVAASAVVDMYMKDVGDLRLTQRMAQMKVSSLMPKNVSQERITDSVGNKVRIFVGLRKREDDE